MGGVDRPPAAEGVLDVAGDLARLGVAYEAVKGHAFEGHLPFAGAALDGTEVVDAVSDG
jgi:hypothetical protein